MMGLSYFADAVLPGEPFEVLGLTLAGIVFFFIAFALSIAYIIYLRNKIKKEKKDGKAKKN